MGSIPLTYHIGDYRFREERICLRNFDSVEDLKAGIRVRIFQLSVKGWNLVEMLTRGSCLFLRFRQKRLHQEG